MSREKLAVEALWTLAFSGSPPLIDAQPGKGSGGIRHEAMPHPQRLDSRGEKYVIGPNGAPLTLSDLPPPRSRHWAPRHKAEVVAAVGGGLLSLDDACSRYSMSLEEFLGWQRSIDLHGLAGLRPKHLKRRR
jgi:hypothetical protein